MVHAWMDDEIVEATGSVHAEQDNQDGSTDFLRYLGHLDMAYLRGNVIVNREAKHKLVSNEGFIFFSTNVFEALGNVLTTVMVDVEKQRQESQGGTQGTAGETSGGGTTPPAEGGTSPPPEGGTSPPAGGG